MVPGQALRLSSGFTGASPVAETGARAGVRLALRSPDASVVDRQHERQQVSGDSRTSPSRRARRSPRPALALSVARCVRASVAEPKRVYVG